MRQGNTLSTLTVGILAIGILSYFVFSFWETMTTTLTTTTAYSYTVSDSVDAKGVLIREEVLLPKASSGLLDVLRVEGEQVGVGQVVGRVYRDAGAMAEQNQLEKRVAEAEVLEFALAEKMDVVTVSKMDEMIVQALSSLRGAVATGNFNNLESQIADVKGQVLRRDYVFGSAMVVDSLQRRYQTVMDEISWGGSVGTGSVTNVTTPVSGAYSILVDGLEYLTPEMAMEMNLDQLDALVQQPLGAVDYGSGKIITGDTWYFTTSLAVEQAENLQEGRGVTVRFSGDFAQDITMKVEKLGFPDGGRQIVVLSSNRYLEQTTLLRIQSVELVYHSAQGLRVPKSAYRMVTYKDGSTGEGQFGVYVISAGYAEFKPASILAEGQDFYVVQAVDNGANALREGNTVVVSAVGLYDGKLLVY